MQLTYEDFRECARLAPQAEYWQWQLEKLQAMAEQVTASIDGIGGSRGNSITDKVGSTATMMVDIKADGGESIIKTYLQKAEAIKAKIRTLENPAQIMIMNMRYVDGMKWEEIAKRSIYSVEWCYKQHRRALKALGLWKNKSVQ